MRNETGGVVTEIAIGVITVANLGVGLIVGYALGYNRGYERAQRIGRRK